MPITYIQDPTYLDVLKAARAKILASPYFAPLIGNDVGWDKINTQKYSGQFNDGWVFYGVGDESAPERDPQNTGTSAVTMTMRTHWTSPNDYNTMEFRQLIFNVYSDMTRTTPGSTGLLGRRDAEDRCDRIAKAIKKEFNDVANEVHEWGNINSIVHCNLLSDIRMLDVYGKDGLINGDLRFKLVLG